MGAGACLLLLRQLAERGLPVRRLAVVVEVHCRLSLPLSCLVGEELGIAEHAALGSALEDLDLVSRRDMELESLLCWRWQLALLMRGLQSVV